MPKVLELSEESKKTLIKVLKDGNWIYQNFKHDCGYSGNSYHKVNDKWEKLTHCPQCNEELKYIKLEEVIKRMFAEIE